MMNHCSLKKGIPIDSVKFEHALVENFQASFGMQLHDHNQNCPTRPIWVHFVQLPVVVLGIGTFIVAANN